MTCWKIVFPALTIAFVSQWAEAAQPVGYLDSAGCDVVAGWSQDPDIPDTPIDVHVYFNAPAGTPGAPAIATHADVHRDDLCTAIGSCNHGYYVSSPFSLHDGAPHDVYAYGIDNAAEGNPVLGNSPRQLVCNPEPQMGIRRKIEGVPVLEAWRFSTFWDVLPISASDAEQLPDGPALTDHPELIQADDGSPEVYLVEYGVRRHVTLNDVAAWRFDLGQVTKMPASEVQAMPEGSSLRPRPLLFIHGALYIVDDAQPFVIPSETSSSSGGATVPDEPASKATCAHVPGQTTDDGWFYATIPLVIALGRVKRKTYKR